MMRLAAVTLAAFALQLCGADGDIPVDDAGPVRDAGLILPPPLDDGGQGADAGDAGPIDPTDGRGESDGAFASVDDADASRSACLDGLDNDRDGLFDCADPVCQVNVPMCCVGQSGSVCCAAAPSVDLPVAGCAGDVALCAAATQFAFFGESSPRVSTHAEDGFPTLSVLGERADTGMAFPEALDPRRGAISLEARLAMPASVPMDLDALGIALIDEALPPEALLRVSPVVGLLASRNRQLVTLLVAGEPVLAWAAPTDGLFHDHRLTVSPDGTVRVSLDGVERAETARVAIGGSLRAVVYGRATNSSEPVAGARLASLTIAQERCDMPAALSPEALPAVPAPSSLPAGWATGRALRAPSVVALEGGSTLMALDVGGEIYLAEGRVDGFHLVGSTAVLTEGVTTWAGRGVADPALLVTSDGQLELWFSALSDDEVWSVGRLRAATVGELAAATPEPVVTPDGSGGVKGVSQATPVYVDGALRVVLRESLEDGSHRLARYELAPTAVRQATLWAPRSADLFAFDRDEVAGPTLVTLDGVHRVYYAGRRGTRWSIGVRFSDDLLTWREAEAPVLGPTGVGFDALGARDPSVLVLDDTLFVYYTGEDGLESRIGWASGPAPSAP